MLPVIILLIYIREKSNMLYTLGDSIILPVVPMEKENLLPLLKIMLKI